MNLIVKHSFRISIICRNDKDYLFELFKQNLYVGNVELSCVLYKLNCVKVTNKVSHFFFEQIEWQIRKFCFHIPDIFFN
jgi:hypothetical protein